MTGSFTVGAVQSTPPPKPTAPQKLTLTLTAKAVTLTKPGGARRHLTRAPAPAVITVPRPFCDAAASSFRGTGISKSTGIGFVGTQTWSVKLGAGPLTVTTQGKTPALEGPRVTVS